MSRNGSGTYNLPVNSWNPAVNGAPATQSDWQALVNDIASALTQSISRDGQTPITANIPMGTNKFTGLGQGSMPGDSVSWDQLFSQGQPLNLDSAATTDIGGQNTSFLNITGTATITSFGTSYNGPRFLRFNGALTLTHNASTLILPAGANITTAENDVAIVVPYGAPASGWIVASYTSAAGMRYTPAGAGAVETTVQEKLRSLELNIQNYGVLPIEKVAFSPTVTATNLEIFRAYAQSQKALVRVPTGTYVLPPATSLAANNTEWIFDPGAIFKLHDTQATTSFITLTRPVNQRVHGLRVDANRANQDPVLFGEDNCAVLIVSPDGCDFESTEIISSPGKGLALVSAEGEYSRSTTINKTRSKDCKEQAMIVDGNNGLGLFDRVIIDDVLIGATSHAGLAVNDGAHNLTISNVDSDVNNSVHDAVSFRDSYDLQLSNIKGKRGRNGVSFEKLNGFCGRIQLSNVLGEGATQSGVLFLGADDITGAVVVGRNNGFAGVNVAALAAYRSGNINLSGVSGYDDRGGSATQDYGLIVQGADDCNFGTVTAYGNTVRNVNIIRSETSNIKVDTRQTVTVSTGSIPSGGDVVITVTWPTPFQDDQVLIDSAYLSVATSGLALELLHLVAITANVAQFKVRSLSGVAQTGDLTVVASRKV